MAIFSLSASSNVMSTLRTLVLAERSGSCGLVLLMLHIPNERLLIGSDDAFMSPSVSKMGSLRYDNLRTGPPAGPTAVRAVDPGVLPCQRGLRPPSAPP